MRSRNSLFGFLFLTQIVPVYKKKSRNSIIKFVLLDMMKEVFWFRRKTELHEETCRDIINAFSQHLTLYRILTHLRIFSVTLF